MMYYEIYKKTEIDGLLLNKFYGIIEVLDEKTDELCNQWCELKLGPMWIQFKKQIIKSWDHMAIQNIHPDDKIITTIQRKKALDNK